MPQKEEQVHQGQQRKNYRYDFKNGIFEGSVAQYKRQGFGIVLLDDGYIYIGNWNNDKVHGRALLFLPSIGVILGNFVKGMQVGAQIVKLYKYPNEYFYVEVKDHLKAPKDVIIFSKDTKTSVQATVKDNDLIECSEIKVTREQEDQIMQLDTLQIKFNSYEFKCMKNINIDGVKQIKIGFMNDPHNRLNGIGLVVEQETFKVVRQGLFIEDRLEGIGKIVMANEDVYEGIFKNDIIDGKGFYYTAKTNSHVAGVFRKDICKEFISDGLEYPTNQIKKLKQNIHEGSINFYSSSFSARDFISIDWSYLSRFTDRQNFVFLETKRNSSPGMSTLLDKINTSNTMNNFQNTRTNSSQRESFSSGYYSFQQNYQSGYNQNGNNTNILYDDQYKITTSSMNTNNAPPSAQRRSNSINGYRTPYSTLYQSHQNSFHVSMNSSQNKFNGQSDKQNDAYSHRKYSRKYIMAQKEHQVENPEVQISNSQIDFGKLNWGSKPKGEDLPFSQTNFNVEREGQDLYDQLNHDDVYKRESRINYFKDGRLPSYEDTIKEGELIKKRLMEMSQFDQIKEDTLQNNLFRQNSGSAQKSYRNTNSQQASYGSINAYSQNRQIQQLSNTPDSLSNHIQNYRNANNSSNLSNMHPQDNIIEKQLQDGNNVQNISDYLRNVAQNDQENYLNQKIDVSQLKYSKQRHLIPYAPNSSGNDQSKNGCGSSQSDYSIQQFDIKKRSSSVSSGAGAIFSKSVASGFDKKGESSPGNNVSASLEKTTMSKNVPYMLNSQITSNNQNIIKLQNLYDEKLRGTNYSNGNEIYPAGQNPQQKDQIRQDISEQKSLNSSIPINTLQSTSSSNQPMKFIKALGVPHTNKNDQLGIYLKMKEESQNRQKEQQQQQQSELLANTSFDVTPISHSASKRPSLDSSRVSILHSYMNPESCSLSHNQTSDPQNSKKINLKDNSSQIINSQSNFQNGLPLANQNQGYYIPQDKEKSNQYVFTFSNNNQSSVISNNSYNQIANEFDQYHPNRPQSAIGLMKDRHKIKLNNILYSSKQQNGVINPNLSIPSNRLPGNQIGHMSNRTENINSHQFNNIPAYTLPVNYNQTETTDNSPYSISKTNPTLNEMESLPYKNKSMVRFNLSTDGNQRNQSFSYKKQQTPEKSSLKGNGKVSTTQQSINNISNGSDQKQRLSTSIDLSNQKYHYSENPVNLFYLNTVQKTQNQWIDLYSVNPQILANSSPQKTLQHRQISNQIQNQQQYLPLLA